MTDKILLLKALKKAFPGIPDSDMEGLLNKGGIADYPSMSVLCEEGKNEEVFYILVKGEVKVTKRINDNEARLLKNLGPGDFFGEMGIIHKAPRAATVMTIMESTVLEIDKEAFEEVLNQSPAVSMAMVREVSQRLRENDEMAIEDLRLKAGELAEAYQQLAELELARREFLTTIAHELRTPLTSANGFMQMIKAGAMQGEALNSGLDAVSRNISQIISLTNDILFLQEMDLILSDFDFLDIEKILRLVIEGEQSYADEMGVRFVLSVAPQLPNIRGDQMSLERAFKAVINNAIKFSGTGKVVQVVAAYNPAYVWVSVRDFGVGISKDDLPKIYDRFWRREEIGGNLYGGIGLGLSIAKQVYSQHQGSIDVRSEEGKGSTFTIKIPLNSAN